MTHAAILQQGYLAESFYLEHKDGTKLFPNALLDRPSGTIAFKVSKGGKGGNLNESAKLVTDEAELMRLVEGGMAVRCKRLGGPGGLYKLGGRSIVWLVRT